MSKRKKRYKWNSYQDTYQDVYQEDWFDGRFPPGVGGPGIPPGAGVPPMIGQPGGPSTPPPPPQFVPPRPQAGQFGAAGAPGIAGGPGFGFDGPGGGFGGGGFNLRPCLFRWVYIWQRNGDQYWLFVTDARRRFVSGLRWTGFNYIPYGIETRRIASFYCA